MTYKLPYNQPLQRCMACWDKDDVEVIPKGTDHTVLFEVHVGLGWFGFLIV